MSEGNSCMSLAVGFAADPGCVTSALQKFESISGGGHLFSWEKR